jgi:cellobiose-specific phosphotransferase system component IIC
MTEGRKTPLHLWIVGVVATLWNSFGVTDYFMTRTKGAEWIDQMMPGVDSAKFMAYIDAFPIWASAGWALGVWGALAGSLLLLARSRHAVTAFAVSLLGAVVGIGYQLANPVDIAEMTQGAAAVMHYVIMAIAAALLWYAQRQKAAGVLR